MRNTSLLKEPAKFVLVDSVNKHEAGATANRRRHRWLQSTTTFWQTAAVGASATRPRRRPSEQLKPLSHCHLARSRPRCHRRCHTPRISAHPAPPHTTHLQRKRLSTTPSSGFESGSRHRTKAPQLGGFSFALMRVSASAGAPLRRLVAQTLGRILTSAPVLLVRAPAPPSVMRAVHPVKRPGRC